MKFVASLLVCVAALPACIMDEEGIGQDSYATTGSGAAAQTLGRSTFEDGFDIKRKDDDLNWKYKADADSDTDMTVQTITFQPGGFSGWHSHPGPNYVAVTSGALTFYQGDDPSCTGTVVSAGQGHIEDGVHFARNEGAVAATVVVAFFTPPAVALRIDQPAPGNCPF